MSLIQLFDAPRGGAIELLVELPRSRRMNRLAIIQRTWESVRYYRSDGKRLRPQPASPLPPITFWLRLWSLLYNPFVDVDFRYEDDGVFDLSEVKRKVLGYVAMDDDILTQFLDRSEIASRLKEAQTFDAVVTTLEAMQGAEEVAEPHTPADGGGM